MLAHATAISSSLANCAVSGFRGVCISRGHGRKDVIVIAAATFPAREVNAAADLHHWHWGAMGMLFRSVSFPPPSMLSANISGGGNE